MKYQEDSLHIFGENTTPASIHNITMLESIEMPSHKIEANRYSTKMWHHSRLITCQNAPKVKHVD